MYLGILFVLLLLAIGLLIWTRRMSAKLRHEAVLEQLRALPPVAKDFSTPEGAILCLEDAYRRRDLGAAIACKDFRTEARLMTERLGPALRDDPTIREKTAEALELSFRTQTAKAWPDFAGIASFFPKREPFADGVVIVTEYCLFPDGRLTSQRLLAAETPAGWRVLNPLPDVAG
jgi:hypothetical protein